MPSFSAESLLSLSGRQFAAATVDATHVTNYDPDSWSRFQLGEQLKIHNDDGLIRTRSDQGWHFTNDKDSGKTQTVKIYDKNKARDSILFMSYHHQNITMAQTRNHFYEKIDGLLGIHEHIRCRLLTDHHILIQPPHS